MRKFPAFKLLIAVCSKTLFSFDWTKKVKEKKREVEDETIERLRSNFRIVVMYLRVKVSLIWTVEHYKYNYVNDFELCTKKIL